MQILMYHSISEAGTPMCVTPAAFTRQMDWLHQAGWRTHTLRLAVDSPSSPRSVVLTFDDGFADAYLTAWPILRERGLTATIFLVTDQVGHVASWTDANPVAPLLDWDQIREMAAGGCEFGSHSASHLDVRTATDEEILQELVRSRQVLEDRVGREVVSFAYPYGYFRPELPGLLQRAGYRFAVLAGGYRDLGPGSDPLRLARTPVTRRDGLGAFRAKVRGWMTYRHYTEKAAVELRWQWHSALRRCGRGR